MLRFIEFCISPNHNINVMERYFKRLCAECSQIKSKSREGIENLRYRSTGRITESELI